MASRTILAFKVGFPRFARAQLVAAGEQLDAAANGLAVGGPRGQAQVSAKRAHAGRAVAELGLRQAQAAMPDGQDRIEGDRLRERLLGGGGVAGQQPLVAAPVGLQGPFRRAGDGRGGGPESRGATVRAAVLGFGGGFRSDACLRGRTGAGSRVEGTACSSSAGAAGGVGRGTVLVAAGGVGGGTVWSPSVWLGRAAWPGPAGPGVPTRASA